MSADGRRPDRSILESLESEGRSAPRVRLRDEEEAEGAPLPSETDRLDSRYERIGLVAEGAVGTILKSRDIDLGRSVAVKILREEHLDDPEMIARFVEEAQIAGQLQHPGIVPVYELGIDADRRPWFAMKLVRGRSFAALLADRKDPSERLRRNLAIFERVCQAVSYAHARGVIHRDLKPSNVMLGAYGEIQVVDWGFARVLAHGGIADERRAKQEQREGPARPAGKEGSQLGSMFGTPPYMSPEQAAGRLDEMDERSDVFSLGSILTEILTGLPAYTGETEEILEKAAGAQIEEAHARLDACGADEGIVAVARKCLAPSKKGRPRDAKALADAVTDFMGQILARAHRAELDAIESKTAAAKAREEADRAGAEAREIRRRRVRGIAVAAILLLTVGCAGALWQWYRTDRASTARENAEALDAALGKAALHLGREEWDEAVGAGGRAVELARAGSVGAGDLRRAEALLARTQRRGARGAARGHPPPDREGARRLAPRRSVRRGVPGGRLRPRVACREGGGPGPERDDAAGGVRGGDRALGDATAERLAEADGRRDPHRAERDAREDLGGVGRREREDPQDHRRVR
jgi:serine/threonine-protein kinase